MLVAAVYRVQHHVLQQKFGAEREHGDDNQQTAVQRVKSLGSVTLLSFSAAKESWLPCHTHTHTYTHTCWIVRILCQLSRLSTFTIVARELILVLQLQNTNYSQALLTSAAETSILKNINLLYLTPFPITSLHNLIHAVYLNFLYLPLFTA